MDKLKLALIGCGGNGDAPFVWVARTGEDAV